MKCLCGSAEFDKKKWNSFYTCMGCGKHRSRSGFAYVPVDKFRSKETGHMVNVKCYDNGGETADRYTVIFTGYDYTDYGYNNRYALASSANPFHPQGFGQHVETCEGSHLGKRIPFDTLPDDVQKFVLQDIG